MIYLCSWGDITTISSAKLISTILPNFPLILAVSEWATYRHRYYSHQFFPFLSFSKVLVAPQRWKPHTDSVKHVHSVHEPDREWQPPSVLRCLPCSLVLHLAPLSDVFSLCDVWSPGEGCCATDFGTDWCGETHVHRVPGFWAGNICPRYRAPFEESACLISIHTPDRSKYANFLKEPWTNSCYSIILI